MNESWKHNMITQRRIFDHTIKNFACESGFTVGRSINRLCEDLGFELNDPWSQEIAILPHGLTVDLWTMFSQLLQYRWPL